MGLEDLVTEARKKAGLVDTFSNITYTTVVGTALDVLSGLSLYGIFVARASSIGTNVVTATPFGWWTEKVYSFTGTTSDSHSIKKRFVDLISFNTFQLPVYAVVLSIGTFISEGHVNFEKVKNGVENLALASPLIGPTLGWYMDFCRKSFGVKTFAEEFYGKKIR